MAESSAGPGGSSGPAAPPSPGGSAEPREDERGPGGGSPESGGAAPDPKPPAMKKSTPSSSGKKKKKQRKAASSPGGEEAVNYRDLNYRDLNYRDWNSRRLSPIAASPQGRERRSWCRSSLKGRRSRRRSLPPLHHELSDLSQSISLELPEMQRLSALLLSSFQFSARKLQQILEENEDFDSQTFEAKVQSGSEDLRRLLQRLLQDGTLGNCVEPSPGDSPEATLDEAVAQVKDTMASLGAELQAWAELLQQHQSRSSEANRNLELLKSGSDFGAPPGLPKNPKILQILSSKPNYEEILRENREIPTSLSITVDEVCQAGKLLKEFSEESETFLRSLSEELAHRTFRKLPQSPARKLLQQKPQK